MPLTQHHAAGMVAVVSAGKVGAEYWRNPYLHIPAPSVVPTYIDRALKAQATGRELPYAVLNPQGEVLGTTRLQSLALGNRRADIGSTWLATLAQGTAVNAVCKWLLLRNAFETMGLKRVGFTVHPDNARSRAALEAMGAQFEGVLRGWQTLHGVQADMCSYSITTSDWADVRARLTWRIEKALLKQQLAI
jgi:N-acetyltransferase